MLCCAKVVFAGPDWLNWAMLGHTLLRCALYCYAVMVLAGLSSSSNGLRSVWSPPSSFLLGLCTRQSCGVVQRSVVLVLLRGKVIT